MNKEACKRFDGLLTKGIGHDDVGHFGNGK
jgi:hypothetical protein